MLRFAIALSSASLVGCAVEPAHSAARPQPTHQAPAPTPAQSASEARPADDAWMTDLDRHVLQQLTGVAESGALVVHYRPGDLTAEQLEQDVAANVADFDELQAKLAMGYSGRIHVFLYRDGDDMRATTEGDSNIAFSTGTVSVHQVHEFRGVHELTHIFALQFPPSADGAGPDLFLTEGLATAMAESDQGVPVDDWAAMYLRLGKLRELSELRSDFMGNAPKGVHPYHVAASFVKSLIDRFGIEKVKAWYCNSTEAGMVFGVPFPRLERDWRERLAAIPVAPDHERYVLKRFSKSLEPLPEAWRTKAGVTLLGGAPGEPGVVTLDALVPDDPSRWTLRDGLLVGTHDGPWTALRSRADFGPDVGLRVRFRLVSGDAVKLCLNGSGEGIFARWSSYLTSGEAGADNEDVKLPAGVWCQAVFVNVGGRGRLFLNGLPVIDEQALLHAERGSVGFAAERGVVEVTEITAFEP